VGAALAVGRGVGAGTITTIGGATLGWAEAFVAAVGFGCGGAGVSSVATCGALADRGALGWALTLVVAVATLALAEVLAVGAVG